MLHCCPVPTRRRWLSPQFPRLGIPPLAGTPPDSFSVPSHLRCSFNAGNAANLRLSPLNSRLGRQVRRPCLSWSTYCRTAIVICKSVARSAFFRSLADPAAPSNPGARTPNSLPKPLAESLGKHRRPRRARHNLYCHRHHSLYIDSFHTLRYGLQAL
jgi:hypothetical protein